MDWIFSWWTAAVVGSAAVVLLLLMVRSFRPGRQPAPGRDAEAKQAEARLWSTLNTNRR